MIQISFKAYEINWETTDSEYIHVRVCGKCKQVCDAPQEKCDDCNQFLDSMIYDP